MERFDDGVIRRTFLSGTHRPVRAVLARFGTLVGVVDIERSGARPFARMAAELRHVAASGSLITVATIRWKVLEDGIVEAHVEPEDGVLDRALNDSITSRAPVGAVHAGLSTYWVDRTESNLRSAQRGGVADPIASGNITYLRLHGSVVVAGYDFDPEEVNAASMPVEEFLALLFEWRTRIIEAGGASGADATKLVDERPRYPLGPAK